jgi:16S rRNA (guanine966-N2)-methyltransferase
MRVVSGSAKGRKLQSVPGDTTRPILDRVKTALFDILRPELSDTKVLDLFGGSGSIGIEALSQGAQHATFIELAQSAVRVIEANLEMTGLRQYAAVRCDDAFRFLKNCKDSFDIVFVAPPQYKGLWIQAMHMLAERPSVIASGGLVVVQIDPVENEELVLRDLSLENQRRYGSTLLLFFRKTEEHHG